jgi:tRNA modification GTPase
MHNIYAPITSTVKSSSIIIRISGTDLSEFFKYFSIKKEIIPRMVNLINLKKSGENIDQVLLTYFKAPNSFTGEDVIEISHHGSQIICDRILRELAKIPNFRFANPGEFTKRAFLNNKIDLVQAEGINDLIKAITPKEAEIALKQLYGENSKYYQSLRDKIIKIRAYLEAFIDFPDDDLDPHELKKIARDIEVIRNEINGRLAKDKNIPKLIEHGIKIAIIGPTNAGKSSLINMLANKEVAIVTNIAGTTRDALEANIEIAGFKVTLIDTAGFRKTNDQIEKLGIEKTEKMIIDSDFILLIIPADNLYEFKNYQNLPQHKIIKIINKIDLADVAEPCSDVNISIKENRGINELLSFIEDKIRANYNIEDNHYITNKRHKFLCEELAIELNKINIDDELIIIAEHLRRSSDIVGRITGIIDIEEILDKIFSSFCIGK